MAIGKNNPNTRLPYLRDLKADKGIIHNQKKSAKKGLSVRYRGIVEDIGKDFKFQERILQWIRTL